MRWYSPRDWIEGEEETIVDGEESIVQEELAHTDSIEHVADGWEADIDDLDLPSIPKVRLVSHKNYYYAI